MFVSSTAAWTPFEASQQGCGEFQSQRGDGICYVTLLTPGRPGAGSLWVRQAFRGGADGLEVFFAPSGAQQRESRKPLCTPSPGDGKPANCVPRKAPGRVPALAPV